MNDPMIHALIGLCLGVLVRALPGQRGHWLAPLSRLLVNGLYPCLIFTSIVSAYDARTIVQGFVLPLAIFLIMLVGYGVGLVWARRRPDDSPATRGTLRFACTVKNYVFLPLVVVGALWGGEGRAAVLLGGLGGDVALWVLGVSCFPKGGSQLGRLFNPPIVTLCASVLLVLSGYTAFVSQGLDVIALLRWPGGLALPAAMAILGFQLGGLSMTHLRAPLAWALAGFHLVFMPALVCAALSLVTLPPDIERMILLISTMPVGLGTVYLGQFFGGDSHLAVGAVLLTHLLALATSPLWLWSMGAL